MPERPFVIVLAAAYCAAVMAIGAWAAARTRTSRDFFIAGQRVGLVLVALATMASAFSGFVFVGGPGLTYRVGLGSLWIVLPVGFTAGLLCWTVARPLRRLAAVREVYTVPDAILCRWQSRRASGLAALAIATGAVAYLAAQLLALGVILESLFGLPGRGWGLAIGLVLLVAYSGAGGMVAGIYTEVVQGGLMLLAAVAVFARGLAVNGGFVAMTAAIAGSERFGPSFLEPLGGVAAHTAFGWFFVFGIGVLGQPHMLHKFYMLDDPDKLRWMPLVLGGSQALCLLVWIGIGLAVPALVASGDLAPLARPDEAAPTFLLHFASDGLAGLVLAGTLAAIMSTANALLNIGAAAAVRDLPRALGRPLADELRVARVAVPLIGLIAGALAWDQDRLVALMGTFAFGTFAAALAPAVVVGLLWRRVSAAAAACSIASGFAFSIGLELATRTPGLQALVARLLAPGVPPAAVALAASFAVLFGATLCGIGGRAGTLVEEDVRDALEL